MHIFISYSRQNAEFCRKIHDFLVEAELDHVVWYDRRIVPGEEWWAQILHQLELADCVLYLLSPTSIESVFCQREYAIATQLKRRVVPILIDEATQVPDHLGRLQWVDMHRGLSEASIPRLLRALSNASRDITTDQDARLTLNDINPDLLRQPLGDVSPAELLAQAQSAYDSDDLSVVLLLQPLLRHHDHSIAHRAEELLEQSFKKLQERVREQEASQLALTDREYRYIERRIRDDQTRADGCEDLDRFLQFHPDYDPDELGKLCEELARVEREYRDIEALIREERTRQEGCAELEWFLLAHPEYESAALIQLCQELAEEERTRVADEALVAELAEVTPDDAETPIVAAPEMYSADAEDGLVGNPESHVEAEALEPLPSPRSWAGPSRAGVPGRLVAGVVLFGIVAVALLLLVSTARNQEQSNLVPDVDSNGTATFLANVSASLAVIETPAGLDVTRDFLATLTQQVTSEAPTDLPQVTQSAEMTITPTFVVISPPEDATPTFAEFSAQIDAQQMLSWVNLEDSVSDVDEIARDFRIALRDVDNTFSSVNEATGETSIGTLSGGDYVIGAVFRRTAAAGTDSCGVRLNLYLTSKLVYVSVSDSGVRNYVYTRQADSATSYNYSAQTYTYSEVSSLPGVEVGETAALLLLVREDEIYVYLNGAYVGLWLNDTGNPSLTSVWPMIWTRTGSDETICDYASIWRLNLDTRLRSRIADNLSCYVQPPDGATVNARSSPSFSAASVQQLSDTRAYKVIGSRRDTSSALWYELSPGDRWVRDNAVFVVNSPCNFNTEN